MKDNLTMKDKDTMNDTLAVKRVAARTFRDLIVWRKAHELVLNVYRFTRQFPSDERFGLIPQFRRAAVSVPANVAEGFRKQSRTDKVPFMNISQDHSKNVGTI